MDVAVLVGLALIAIPLYQWPYVDARTSPFQQAALRFIMFGVGLGFLIGLLTAQSVR